MPGNIISGDRSITQEQLLINAARAAGGLSKMGVKPGNAVAIMMRNDIAMLEASLAARMMSAYPVPVNWHYKGDEAGYIFDDCDAKALVIHADLLPQCQGHIPDGLPVFVVETPPEIRDAYGIPANLCQPEEQAIQWNDWVAGQDPLKAESQPTQSIIYTSGTTGRPKGVRRQPNTPENDTIVQGKFRRVFGINPEMTALIPAPMYHSAPNAFGMTSVIAGGNLVLQPRFTPEGFLKMVEEHRIDTVQMVPTMFVRLLKLPEAERARYDVSSLKFIVHAAAPCPPDVKQAMIDWWGPIIHEYYGATEAGAITFCDSSDTRRKPGTVGRALQGATVKILDDDGNELPTGGIGNVFMIDQAMPDFTYHKKDEKRREMETSGLITCGDIGYLDEEGYLFLCDRKIDMVISGGVNIYPAEIEAVLINHPKVKDCCVFGIPDEEYGESLAAAVQPEVGEKLSGGELKAFLTEKVAGYKVPRVFDFHDDLPREDTGKIFKRKLREPYWEGVDRRI